MTPRGTIEQCMEDPHGSWAVAEPITVEVAAEARLEDPARFERLEGVHAGLHAWIGVVDHLVDAPRCLVGLGGGTEGGC